MVVETRNLATKMVTSFEPNIIVGVVLHCDVVDLSSHTSWVLDSLSLTHGTVHKMGRFSIHIETDPLGIGVFGC